MSSPATVQGKKYETFIGGIGADSSVGKRVFIPAYQLDLSQDGRVNRAARHLGTLAALKASLLVANKIKGEEYRDQNGKFTISFEDIRQMVMQAAEEADAAALTSVQISKDLVDQIKTLYDRSMDANTPKDQVHALQSNIKQIILGSGLFND
jgi:hypothetical protein